MQATQATVQTVRVGIGHPLAGMLLSPRVAVRFSRAERKTFRRRRPVPVSSWAERHRWVTMSKLPGRWSNAVAPYITGIMDASFHRAVREVIICGAPQTAKSEAVITCLGYGVDRAPGPAMLAYPDEPMAMENSRDRVLPMFSSSPRLREYLSQRNEDVSGKRINLVHMPIYFSWSGSVSTFANRPIKYGIADEVDKWAEGRKEADPLDLLRARFRTYSEEYKLWVLSSPSVETGPIWMEYQRAAARFVYLVRCQECGHLQEMVFKGISAGGCRDGARIMAEKLGRYACSGCGSLWDDGARDLAVAAGSWHEERSGEQIDAFLQAHRTRSIAFRIPSWLSRFVSLSEVLASWFDAFPEGGPVNLKKFKDFQNKHAAEPWRVVREDRPEDAILSLRDDRPEGIVPSGGVVAVMLGMVDTQDNGWWYEIRAFGYGTARESWGVRCGFLDDWQAVLKVLFEDQYFDAAGNRYLVRAAGVDIKGHRTAEMYDHCRAERGRLVALQGSSHRMQSPYTWSQIDYYPGTKKPIPGGLKLLRLNPKHYKDLLDNKLRVAPEDPGAWHLSQAGGYNEDWAKQLCAEFLNDAGEWECQPGRGNHAWDLGYYFLGLADVLGVAHWPRPENQSAPRRRRIISHGVER